MSRARAFKELHHGSDVLVLANVWDAGSARVAVACGAKAVATSSGAVAWAHGFADGEKLPPQLALATVREIARVAGVPITVDLEAGYGDVGGIIRDAVDSGAVGCNLEDGGDAPEDFARKIEAAKKSAGDDIFVNARTDVYLRAIATGEAAVAETLRRAKLYRDAGADGIFVPGVVEERAIAELAAAAGLPLNVLVRKNLPPISKLRTLGVKRVSAGSTIGAAALAFARRAMKELLDDGTYGALYADTFTHAELNALFK